MKSGLMKTMGIMLPLFILYFKIPMELIHVIYC